MKRPNQPRYWQLDVFVVLMIGLMILLMRINPAPLWESIGEIGWCILALAGMAWWICDNQAALQQEEQRSQRTAGTLPPTPVQRRFLAVTQAQSHTTRPSQAQR